MGELKVRPILFSAPMVRAILLNKRMTRRIAKPDRHFQRHNIAKWGLPYAADPGAIWWHGEETDRVGVLQDCPYGVPGDRLWVRETWCQYGADVIYKADYGETGKISPISDGLGGPWKPSIHMPRWACRIYLEVTAVRAERLQDISEDDCYAEGIVFARGAVHGKPRWIAASQSFDSPQLAFAGLWHTIHAAEGLHGWNANPVVRVVEFKRIEVAD